MGTTADLDARDGTPILDLKPYIPEAVTPSG
jgi:tRNA (Thr-GGU) A37 N-methylase